MISIRPVEDAVFCEEAALDRVAVSTFAIGDSVEDGVSLCILSAIVRGKPNRS